MSQLPRIVLTIALLFAAAGPPDRAAGQTKGQLSYNPDKDAAYLILRGRNDERAARLSVDGDENLRGFLELHRDGDRGFYAYVDSDGEGGLTLSSPAGDAVNLFIDDSSNSGVFQLRDGSGDTRVRLFVDDRGQGQLRLDGETDGERVSLYIDPEDQGGLRIRDDSGDSVATLYVDDDSDTGVLVLGESGGQTRAFLRVTDGGRGTLSLDGSDNVEKARLYVDGEDQGGLRLRTAAGNDGAVLFIADSSDVGILRLMNGGGSTRAELRVTNEGRGLLSLDGGDALVGAQLYVDARDEGGLRLRAGADGDRATLFVGDASGGGVLQLRDASGAVTITLDGATGVISKSGVNGFLIPHPRQEGQEIFYASLEGPEAAIHVRGRGRLENGVAEIRFPGHFRSVARARTVNVQVTPTTVETNGLAVVRSNRRGFEVRELGGGEGEATFDWFATAERGDIDPIEVVRDAEPAILDNVSFTRPQLDLTAVPRGMIPILDPRPDRPIDLTRERLQVLGRGEIVRPQIDLAPDLIEERPPIGVKPDLRDDVDVFVDPSLGPVRPRPER